MNLKTIVENKRFHFLIFALEFCICMLVFVSLSGGKGVDWDEAFTHQLVLNNDVLQIIRGTATDVHPPLYYLIVKLFITLFGNHFWAYTWASIAAFIGCFFLSVILVYRTFGFFATALLNIALAFAPTVLFYNMNIRMYSWTFFFCFGCSLIAMELMKGEKPVYWCLLFVFSICGVYTQYFAVFPIVATYACLVLYLVLHKQWKRFIPFSMVCILNVVSFLPWLNYASGQFAVSGIQTEYIDRFSLNPIEFFSFSTTCKTAYADSMLMTLFFASFFIYLFIRKAFQPLEQWYIGLLYFICVFCFIGSQVLAIFGNHFFSWRYIYPVTAFIWVLFCLIFTRMGLKVAVPFSIFTLSLCYTSYLSSYNWEYNMTPLLEKTIAFTEENIAPDSIIVFDYGNFDTLYKVYLPGHEFVYFDDLDLSTMKGQTFWFIQLGGQTFTEGTQAAYGLEIEHYSDFGYMGMVKFELEKVTVTK